MRWLICEDALRNRKGHWYEYISSFHHDLRGLGDSVDIIVDRCAEPFILDHFAARPVLPESIWHRMDDGAGRFRRQARVFTHAWNTYKSLVQWVRSNASPDVAFVPTVLVHHLLGWTWFIKRTRPKFRVLLFFPNLPICQGADGKASWSPSPTTRLLSWLLGLLRPELAEGRVILGVETHAMRKALIELTGLPVVYFPHAVSFPAATAATPNNGLVRMGCYGPARHEKGSDVLVGAIKNHLSRRPETRSRFAFQWFEDFKTETGQAVSIPPELLADKRVEVIRNYFKEGEYAYRLASTDTMLLPYRISSYGLRVSRVVIEAMALGLPVVVTEGTTLAAQAAEFGAAVNCLDGNIDSVTDAIAQLEACYPDLQQKAQAARAAVRAHFSVAQFRTCLMEARTDVKNHPKQDR